MKKVLAVIAVLAASGYLYAGSTGSTTPQTPSGTPRTSGDYLSVTNGLNTAYRYFVEVPPGLGRLVIELFDADIGLGGNNEGAAGRDRNRTGYNTTAIYSLVGPDGVARRTTFTTGSATTPAGADNAWLAFFDSTGDTVRDNFGTAAYTNNDGSLNWSSNWTETNDDNNAGTGMILITGGELRIEDNNDAAPSTITRTVDLSGWTGATVTFTTRTQNVEAGDQMAFEVWNGATWTRLATYTGAHAATARSYDLTPYRAANTQIRFIEISGYGNRDYFFVDNVEIKENSIRNGHWQVSIDQSAASGNVGGDINAVGLRAHDGTSGAGGTELPVYADSFVTIGANPPASGTTSRTYTLYPYVTSGCSCSHNDFDYDSNSGTVGSAAYASRTGTFTQTFGSASLSANDVWARNAASGWTSDSNATDYGIWSLTAAISSYLVAGNPNGNYTAIYDSNYAAAANPPAANPQANAFRIYFPSDAGTAPVKPYLEQLLTKRGGGDLVVGVPAVYTVTVRLVNPTAHAITANLVTANVPGVGATYDGKAAVAQGTLLSQPALGGTGNITWNPGTVATGATVALSYDVVVTATSNGQRIPLTGTPASGNGTRATWIDETGNTTQARATFTFGPLCELAANENLLTEVLLSSFSVDVTGSVTHVKWETASEAGTIGFNLYRLDRATGELIRLNESLLPANPGAGQGGRYRFVDKTNTSSDPSYVLEEMTANGRVLRYGPYAAEAGADAGPLPDGDFAGEPRGGDQVPVPLHGKKIKADAVMAGIRHGGVYQVTASDLSSILGMPIGAVNAFIGNGHVSLTERGADVAWTAGPGNDSILFYGQRPDSIYSNERIYRIALDKGTRMSGVDVATTPATGTTFTSTTQFEADVFAATALPLSPESDYWFWDSVISGYPGYSKKSFTLDVPSVTAGNAALQVRLQGAIAGGAHLARVALNGTLLGEMTWSSLDATSTELPIPAGVLRDGANTVSVEGVLASGAAFDGFYIDGFAVRYTRMAHAIGGTLEATVQPGMPLTATGLTPEAIVLDISNVHKPAVLRGGTSFIVPPGTSAIFFSDPSAISPPDSIRGSTSMSLADRRNAADYLIITNAALRSGADALAQFRSRDGLQTFVAELDDVYDEFAGGNSTPHAIRDFIAATRSWSKVPRYVVLAGIGTIDYRGLTTGPGLLPPLLTTTSNGLFAADSLFTDFNGDGLPDIAVGRIPAASNDEMLAYVAKLASSAAAPVGAAVFAADASDHGADFRRQSSLAEAPLQGRPITQIHLDVLGAAASRAAFLQAWNGGASFVSWMGHGGMDRISNSSLLNVADAPSLTSTTGSLPVFVAMTCTINRFELGMIEPLGSALTRAANAGALAVWAPSGLSDYIEATELARTFTRLATNSDAPRVGDLVVQSLAASKARGETGNVYLLLGDPAVPVRLPAVIQGPGGPPSGVE